MSMDVPSSGSTIIAKAIKELQESNIKLQKDNAEATKKYLIITVIATITSGLLGVVLGTYLT